MTSNRCLGVKVRAVDAGKYGVKKYLVMYEVQLTDRATPVDVHKFNRSGVSGIRYSTERAADRALCCVLEGLPLWGHGTLAWEAYDNFFA